MAASAKPRTNGFDEFKLHPEVRRGIDALGWDNPRPIQVETIPSGLRGKDILGLAQTGTGKTAAFAIPIIDILLDDKHPGPRAMVLAPTRELATQIAREFEQLSKFTGLRTTTLYGGVSIKTDIKELKRDPEIVVGCPGRVLDLIHQKILHVNDIEMLVLDEADHMFDMGFLPDIKKILRTLPGDRQNLLFSATMPMEIRTLADRLLNKPHVAELSNAKAADMVDHAIYVVGDHEKKGLLDQILRSDDFDSAIIFTRTKHRARRLADQLRKAGHPAIGLQGNMSQSQRDKAMTSFRTGKKSVLVATDIVSRGIDVSGISHVINFDVPNTPEAYTHRIGRTGRSETSGIARTFVTGADFSWLKETERMLGERIARLNADGTPAAESNEPAVQKPRAGRGMGMRRGRSG